MFLTEFATLLVSVICLDISDPIFDGSWVSEVPYVEHLTPKQMWTALFEDGLPIKTSLPALLAVRDLWSNEYLINKFGHELVRTEPDRENRTVDYCGLERKGEIIQCNREDRAYTKQLSLYYSLEDFLTNMTSTTSRFHRYVITSLPESMSQDLPFLSSFSCGLKRRYYPFDQPANPLHMTQISELNFWLSRGSTYSAIHYDMNQQIMCQIDGRKEWRFWDLQTELPHIPMWSDFYPDTMSSDDSPIDPLDVDLDKYPDFKNARWMNATLNPGECILIPSRHSLHFVRGFPDERNIGFSVHVNSEYPKESFYDCDVGNLTHSNLSDFPVMWPFPGDARESGYQTVRMGFGEWKGYAVYALKRLSQDVPIERSIAELTSGRSVRSPHIKNLLKALPNDAAGIFNYAPLWREVLTLST